MIAFLRQLLAWDAGQRRWREAGVLKRSVASERSRRTGKS
jgi:hypothetical protein